MPALGVSGGVSGGVLAGVLVDGVAAGLSALLAMSSTRSFGSWGMSFRFSQEPFVQAYLPYPSISVGAQLRRESWNLTFVLHFSHSYVLR